MTEETTQATTQDTTQTPAGTPVADLTQEEQGQIMSWNREVHTQYFTIGRLVVEVLQHVMHIQTLEMQENRFLQETVAPRLGLEGKGFQVVGNKVFVLDTKQE